MFKQDPDRVDTHPDHDHIDGPEGQEADQLRGIDAQPGDRRELFPRGDVDGEDLVDRSAADPGLDAEPAARDQGPQERGTFAPRIPNDARQ